MKEIIEMGDLVKLTGKSWSDKLYEDGLYKLYNSIVLVDGYEVHNTCSYVPTFMQGDKKRFIFNTHSDFSATIIQKATK